MTFDKYKKNLKFDFPFVYSYNTKVAELKDGKMYCLGYWSSTTSKHINYAAKELYTTVIKWNPND